MLFFNMMSLSIENFLLLFMLAVSPTGLCQDTPSSGTRLEPGTPAYQVAVDLAKIYPFLDPDVNNILIEGETICITIGDVIDELNFFFPPIVDQMLARQDQDQVLELSSYTAEQIAHRRLLVNTARSEGISVPEFTVDSLASIYRLLKVRSGQLNEYLESKGKTMDYIRNRVESDELSRRVAQLWMKDVNEANEDEIRAAYKQAEYLNLRYIFLSTEGPDKARKNQKLILMGRIQQLLTEGFSFAELEQKYSDDVDSSKEEGEKKGVRRGQFPPLVDGVIFQLNEGDLSDIIETDQGIYLFKVEQHVRDTRPFEKAYQVYKSKVEREKRLLVEKRNLQEMIEKENLKFYKQRIRQNE